MSDCFRDPDDDQESETKYTFTPYPNELYIYKGLVKKHKESNSVSFEPDLDENVQAYIPGQDYNNLTDNYMSNVNYYSSDVHERLGEYLRFYRDYYNINLMSLYNCFSNRYIDKFSLPITMEQVGGEVKIVSS